MKYTKLYLVIPCYNEEEVLPETLRQLSELIYAMLQENKVHPESRILCVDDGSDDKTWNIIEEYAKKNSLVTGLKLAKNVGHQNALLAGLMEAKKYCDCCISLDADLQDDIQVIPAFLEKYELGNDIVYGIRNRRKNDTFFKRGTAKVFYRLLSWLGADIHENHADYRLMSKAALEALAEFPEVNLFLRGMVRLIGLPSDVVYYERKKRLAGESKYPFRKMLSFAFDGVTSFSIKPIRLVLGMGILVCILALFAAGYTLFARFFGFSVSGWTSLMISIWFLGGVQLISLGVIGEYIGKIYKETKRRPRYMIEKSTEDKKKDVQ